MSSADFRHISSSSGRRNDDRLFKAAVSAFCSITRPTRNDVIQLEELVLPLIGATSATTRRYAAAALSESDLLPKRLVLELCNDKPEICAPLLSSAGCFTEGDLVTLLGRHGTPHGRLIARRKSLHPVVHDLLLALGDAEIEQILNKDTQQNKLVIRSDPAHEKTTKAGDRAEAVRTTLRQTMAGNIGANIDDSDVANDDNRRQAEKLRTLALSGNPALLQTAIADSFGLSFPVARKITEDKSWSRLSLVMKALGISDAEAFLLVSAAYPGCFSSPELIAGFLEQYANTCREAAHDQIILWKTEAFKQVMYLKSGPLSDRRSTTTLNTVADATDELLKQVS